MSRILDALFILFKGRKALVAKDKNKLPTTFAKETEKYFHEDIEGVAKEELDFDTFQTVSLPNSNKLVTARNKKTKEIQGVRMLIKKEEKKK